MRPTLNLYKKLYLWICMQIFANIPICLCLLVGLCVCVLWHFLPNLGRSWLWHSLCEAPAGFLLGTTMLQGSEDGQVIHKYGAPKCSSCMDITFFIGHIILMNLLLNLLLYYIICSNWASIALVSFVFEKKSEAPPKLRVDSPQCVVQEPRDGTCHLARWRWVLDVQLMLASHRGYEP